MSPKAPGKPDVSIATRSVPLVPPGRQPRKRPTFPVSTPFLRRISGRDNPEFKRFLAVKARKNRDLILVDGPKMLGEAIRSGMLVEAVALDEASMNAHRALVEGPPLVIFTPPLIKALSDVETPQGILALVRRPRFDETWVLDQNAFVLVLDGLQDPGNVGTLFRTAEATGVTGILMTMGCADPFSPKALRSSAGSVFRVPHIAGLSIDDVLRLLPKSVALLTTSVAPSSPSLFDAELRLPLALALGSEGSGLDRRIEGAATQRVRIPQARPVESLNVAAAGAVALFEIARRAGILQS